MLILTVILMDILIGMEFDLFVPSFPELQDYFNLSPSWVEMALSVNFIGYCISLFVVGELADRYGRKSIILLGLLTFILGSLLCLSTTSYYFILCGRFLQGLGIAAPSILSFLIIADAYPVKKQQSLLAILNGSMNIAVAFSPVIGSFITKQFHWKWNFVALLLLGLITFGMTLFFIPANKIIYEKTRSVLQGSIALTFALGSLAFEFIVNRYDQKKMLSIANQILIFSFICLMLVTFKNGHNPLLITLAFIPFVIGQIMPGNILYPLYLNLMPEAKGKLTAIIQGGRLIFGSLGIQIASYFYQGSFRNIGIIVGIFVFSAVIMMFFVVRQWSIIKN
jgi:DHA1 family bicyclomycin/chloramphenicol resistance-like MFS transporter